MVDEFKKALKMIGLLKRDSRSFKLKKQNVKGKGQGKEPEKIKGKRKGIENTQT